MTKIATARQKGKDFENLVADLLKEKGLDSRARQGRTL